MLAMLRQAAALAIACALFPGIGERIAYRRGNAEQLEQSACKSGYEEVYEKKEDLGTGGHATAYKVIDKETNQEFCAKQITKDNEFDILEAVPAVLRLPFTSAVTEVYPEEKIYVMPLYGGGELFKRVFNSFNLTLWKENPDIGKLCEQATNGQTEPKNLWLAQSAYGLYQLHKHGIIHADFKLENAVTYGDNNERMVVIDYGASQLGCPVNGSACCGTSKVATTPGIFPPYTCNAEYSFEVDFFSWAIAAWELLMEYPLINRGRLERGDKTDCQLNDQEAERVLETVFSVVDRCEKNITENNLLLLIISVLKPFKDKAVDETIIKAYRHPTGPRDHPVLHKFKAFGINLTLESDDDAAQFWPELCQKFAEEKSKGQCGHDSKSSPGGLLKQVDGLCRHSPGKRIEMRLDERLSPRMKNKAAIKEDCRKYVFEQKLALAPASHEVWEWLAETLP